MYLLDPYLYLVTHRKQLTRRKFLDIIGKAVQGGVRCVQLREKDSAIKEFIDIGKELKSFLKPYHVPLIINDRVDVALAVGADGVHLGQKDMYSEDVRRLLGEKLIIGISVETIEQALIAQKLPINYIAASPVFSSKTKTDISEPWGIDGLKKLKKISSHPLVAIGGINNNNVKPVCQAGVHGIAVVSSIFDASDPYHAAQTLYQEIKKWA